MNNRKEYMKKWREEHKEHIRQYKKEYAKTHDSSFKKLQQKNQSLKKQLEERDKWLIVCISELMEIIKKDTFWITNEQIESTKNKNISYEIYGGNDIKFYQNIKK